jgi:hypothetical protein
MKSATINKRSFLLLAASLFVFNALTFAQTAKDVFGNSETPILYLGIDFTKAKIIDDPTTEFDIRDKYYPGVNDLIVGEGKKYDLKGAFHKGFMDHDLGPVMTRNAKINAETIKSTNTADFHKLQAADIESLVKGFDFGDKKGVGLLFVAEAFSKSEKATAFWVTLVDMQSRRVIMTERMQGKAGGFGLRNTIATSLKNILEEIQKTKYQIWKTKYANS